MESLSLTFGDDISVEDEEERETPCQLLFSYS